MQSALPPTALPDASAPPARRGAGGTGRARPGPPAACRARPGPGRPPNQAAGPAPPRSPAPPLRRGLRSGHTAACTQRRRRPALHRPGPASASAEAYAGAPPARSGPPSTARDSPERGLRGAARAEAATANGARSSFSSWTAARPRQHAGFPGTVSRDRRFTHSEPHAPDEQPGGPIRCGGRDAPFLSRTNEREALEPMAQLLRAGAPVGPELGGFKGAAPPAASEQRERSGPPSLRSSPAGRSLRRSGPGAGSGVVPGEVNPGPGGGPGPASSGCRFPRSRLGIRALAVPVGAARDPAGSAGTVSRRAGPVPGGLRGRSVGG